MRFGQRSDVSLSAAMTVIGRLEPWAESVIRSLTAPSRTHVIKLSASTNLFAIVHTPREKHDSERWNHAKHTFYPRGSMTSYMQALVLLQQKCLSVCPSHSGIVSKRTKLASWFLHQLKGRKLYSFADIRYMYIGKFERGPRASALEWVRLGSVRIIDLSHCCSLKSQHVFEVGTRTNMMDMDSKRVTTT